MPPPPTTIVTDNKQKSLNRCLYLFREVFTSNNSRTPASSRHTIKPHRCAFPTQFSHAARDDVRSTPEIAEDFLCSSATRLTEKKTLFPAISSAFRYINGAQRTLLRSFSTEFSSRNQLVGLAGVRKDFYFRFISIQFSFSQ